MICSVADVEVAWADGDGGTVPVHVSCDLEKHGQSISTYLDQYQIRRWRHPHLREHQTKLPRTHSAKSIISEAPNPLNIPNSPPDTKSSDS